MKLLGIKSFTLGNIFFVALFFLLWITPSHSQWVYTYGGDVGGTHAIIRQTSGGSFIMAGATDSFGAGGRDLWIFKLDNMGGIVWQKTYGGSDYEYCFDIQETSLDGGYIVAAATASFGVLGRDFLILKLDSTGGVIWQKAYGGANNEYPYSIKQTGDGGYIVAGETWSFGEGSVDPWIIKLNSAGELMWEKTYGGAGYDYVQSIQQTIPDGGYIVAGRTDSFGSGSGDFLLLKLDSIGNITWQKTYGGAGTDEAYSIQQTQDGGYIVGGASDSFGSGSMNLLILKLDGLGDIAWQNNYGVSGSDFPASTVQQTNDGGYIVSWTTDSFGNGLNDGFIMKLTSNGSIEWQKTYGDSGTDQIFSILQTTDGGYLVTGDTNSFAWGQMALWALKLDSKGSTGSCPLKAVSKASVSKTTVTIVDTNIVPITSTATVIDTTVTVTDTDVSKTQLCPPVFNLLTPNGGEKLATHSACDISWTPYILASSFKVSYSLNNGSTWGLVDMDITGTGTTWTTPLLTKNKTKCLVKVTAYDDKGKRVGVDKSDGLFAIEALTITDINGGTACTGGQTCPITWEMADTLSPDQLQLSYTFDGGITWKKENAIAMPGGSTYNWTAPTVMKNKTCKVKLTFKADGTTVATATSIKFTMNKPQ